MTGVPHEHARRPSALARLMILGVRGYQVVLGPLLGGQCRYAPTCSVYAIEALERHGARRGGWLTLRRVARCHPWGGMGHDPVPRRPSDPDPAMGQRVDSQDAPARTTHP